MYIQSVPKLYARNTKAGRGDQCNQITYRVMGAKITVEAMKVVVEFGE